MKTKAIVTGSVFIKEVIKSIEPYSKYPDSDLDLMPFLIENNLIKTGSQSEFHIPCFHTGYGLHWLEIGQLRNMLKILKNVSDQPVLLSFDGDSFDVQCNFII